MRRDVVPRTMESSINTTRLPSTMDRTALSFNLTPVSRNSCEGWINVRAMYLFLISPVSSGRPLASAYPAAAETLSPARQ